MILVGNKIDPISQGGGRPCDKRLVADILRARLSNVSQAGLVHVQLFLALFIWRASHFTVHLGNHLRETNLGTVPLSVVDPEPKPSGAEVICKLGSDTDP